MMNQRTLAFALTLGLVVTLAFAPSAANAGGANVSLSVDAAAAIDGAFGMRIDFDGTTSGNGVYVQDNTPDTEATYNVEHRFNRNNLNMPDGGNQVVMLVRNDPATRNNIRMILTCRNGPCDGTTPNPGQRIELVVQVRKDALEPGGGWRFCGRAGIGGGNKTIRFETIQGTGANDGTCRLFRNDVLLFEKNNFPNDEMDVDTVRWGALNPVETAFTGFTKNDSFVSTR